MILHESVKEDLVLITERGEESVLENDGWLLRVAVQPTAPGWLSTC